jgi:hypothetical protein
MNSRWNNGLRASLDELREYQAVDAPSWFHAKERLDGLFRDEVLRRSTAFPGGETENDDDDDEDEDEDEDVIEFEFGFEEMRSSDVEEESDGTDDGDDDEEDETTEKGTDVYQAGKEAARAAAAQELTEIGKMMRRLCWVRMRLPQTTEHLRAKQRRRSQGSLASWLAEMRLTWITQRISVYNASSATESSRTSGRCVRTW